MCGGPQLFREGICKAKECPITCRNGGRAEDLMDVIGVPTSLLAAWSWRAKVS